MRLQGATPTDPYVTHSVIRFLGNQHFGILMYDHQPGKRVISHEQYAASEVENDP